MVDPSRIDCIEGPGEFSIQSAEVQLAVSGGQPLFTLGSTMFALSLWYFLSLPWAPSTHIDFFIYVKNIIWRTNTKSSKTFHEYLKLEWGLWEKYWLNWKRLQFEVFFSWPFDVLLRVIYANMLVATQWPANMHLTFWWPLSDHWSMHLTYKSLCGMEVWKLIGTICAMNPINKISTWWIFFC